MHEKWSKIDFFFANFRKLQKKLPTCKKRYAEILNVARAVVTNVEKRSNRHSEFFLFPQKSRQAVIRSALKSIDPGAANGGSNFEIRPLEADLVSFEVARLPEKRARLCH